MMRFINGVVYTLDPRRPRAAGFAVVDGRITELNPPDQGDGVVDLEGRVVLPAFVDAHIHLWKVGDLLDFTVDLRGSRSIGEVQRRIAEFAATRGDLPVIRARGFNEASLAEGRMLTREDLDQVDSRRPIHALRTCAHIAVVNSAGLAACALDDRVSAPPGGEVRRDPRGRLTGVFAETALGLVAGLASRITAAEFKTMIRRASHEMLRHGITAVSDPAVGPDLMRCYRELDAEGGLPIRVNAFAIGIPDGATEALPLPEPYRSESLVIDTIKFFADGGLSGGTAALSRPYLGTDYRGVLRLNAELFESAGARAVRSGFRIATHAIGDRAIDLVLNGYQRFASEVPDGPRHRIEHLGLPTEAQKDRIRDLGVAVATQPIFLDELGRNFRSALDTAYLEQCYPVRSLLDRGIPTAFSSDAPVVRNLDPLRCVRAAVARAGAGEPPIAPLERVSVAEGIRCHVTGAADVGGWSASLGMLSVGRAADFVVLDRDPLTDDGADMGSLWATYRAGLAVYQAL